MPRHKVALITKLRTVNSGNQAVSNELIALAQESFRKDDILCLESTSFFKKVRSNELIRAEENAFTLFESWADEILNRFTSGLPEPSRGGWNAIPSAKMVSKTEASMKLIPLKRKLRGLMASLPSLNDQLGNDNLMRIKYLRAADLVIYNPAGQMHSERGAFDVPLQELVELRILQKLGCRIGVINHSVEIREPTLLSLTGRLYSGFDFIVVRDEISRQILAQVQVPDSKIQVLPDLAFLTNPPKQHSALFDVHNSLGPNDHVGIAVGHLTSEANLLEWEKIILGLQQRGKRITFISNAIAQDLPIAKRFQKKFSIGVIQEVLNYKEYLELLAGFELIITSRLHTGILGLVGNTPIIPIEQSFHRIRGLFQSIEYPVLAVSQSNPGWAESVHVRTREVYANYPHLKCEIEQLVRKCRNLSRGGYQNLLRSTLN